MLPKCTSQMPLVQGIRHLQTRHIHPKGQSLRTAAVLQAHRVHQVLQDRAVMLQPDSMAPCSFRSKSWTIPTPLRSAQTNKNWNSTDILSKQPWAIARTNALLQVCLCVGLPPCAFGCANLNRAAGEVNYAKWMAWKRCASISSEEAMARFVGLLDEMVPGWDGDGR